MTIYRLDLYNTSGVKQYEVSDFLNLAYTKRVNAPGVMQFTMPGDHDLVSNIADKWQVEVWRKPALQSWTRDFVGLYRMLTWSQYDTKKAVYLCPGLMSMLDYATVAWPAGTVDRSLFAGTAAESIMKLLVQYNATTDATSLNERTRTHTQTLYTGLSVEATADGGNDLDWACANDGLLETLQKLTLKGGGDFDLVKTSATAWQFRFYAGQLGTDRSATVKFALGLGNMANPEYIDNRTGEATAAVVGGRGEGADRNYVVRTGDNFSAANDIEMFVNATDVDTTAGLEDRGDEKLAEVKAVSSFTFDVLQAPATLYGVHYFLGDLVKAVNPATGAAVTRKVNSVTVTVDDSGQEGINVELVVV